MCVCFRMLSTGKKRERLLMHEREQEWESKRDRMKEDNIEIKHEAK